jgi:nucleolar protein 14
VEESEEESGSEEEEDDWEDEDGAGDKAGSGSDSDADSDEDEDEEEDEEDDESEDEYDREYKARLSARIGAPKSGAAAAAKSKAKRVAEEPPAPVPAADASGVNEKMPHKIDCPSTMEGFDELIDNYVVSTADMNALVERILIWNSVKLPGQQGASNRGPMHNFLDIMIRHFVRVGNSLGVVSRQRPSGETAKTDRCSESVESVRSQLDFLTKAIHQLTSDIDTVSVALWRKTIKTQFISVLAKKLRDYAIGVDVVSCFPSLGRLMLIKLIGQIFSVTDYTHALITPLVLYMCQCITQSPVNTPLDVSSGLFMTSMLLDFTAETNKYIPEVLLFLRSVVSLYFTPAGAGFMRTSRLGTFNSVSLSWLRGALGEPSTDAPGRLAWKFFGLIDSCKFDASDRSVDAASLREWSYAIFSTAQVQIAEIRTRYTQSVAFPEISCLLLEDLRVLRPQDSPAFPKSLLVRHLDELDKLIHVRNRCMHGAPAPAAGADGESTGATSGRNPMQWRPASKKAISTLVPRYDVNYSLQMKNPFDPNKDKAKAKTLTKQLKREQKAAMRELRRDADYVEQEKFAVDTKKKEAARAERVRNYGILEQEQGMINQQVRMGKASDIKGGGSSGVGLKRARISKY